MSPDRIDKGVLQIQWQPRADQPPGEEIEAADPTSWLLLRDGTGVGAAVSDEMRRRGHRIRVIDHDDRNELAATDFAALFDDDLRGIIDCWPLDITESGSVEEQYRLGVLTALRLAKALAQQDTPDQLRLHVVTANAQPAPEPNSAVSTSPRCGGSVASSATRSYPSTGADSSTSMPPTATPRSRPASANTS